MRGLCNPEPCDLWSLWLEARPICRAALWRLWNHREVQQGPSSNNCSALRGEAFPPLTQRCLVLQPTKHLSAKLRGRAGWAVGRGGWGGWGEGGGCRGLQCGPGHCGERVNLSAHWGFGLRSTVFHDFLLINTPAHSHPPITHGLPAVQVLTSTAWWFWFWQKLLCCYQNDNQLNMP